MESWLGLVETAMVASLRRLAKAGMGSYGDESRTDWVQQPQCPSQLIIAISQVGGGGAMGTGRGAAGDEVFGSQNSLAPGKH